MKAFIIYVKGHVKSEQYADLCLKSCADKFEVELFEGVTPITLSKYEEVFTFNHVSPSRVESMKKESEILYQTKKSCFLNHVRLWHLCTELNQPIAILEHDSHCIKKWDNIEFDELLILNAHSALNEQHIIKKVYLLKNIKPPRLNLGLNDYNSELIYNQLNAWHGACMMPGTAAYAITPKGAKKLINMLYLGWEQSDHYINTKNIRIQYVIPEYFTFKMPNLNMSFDYTKGENCHDVWK